MDSTVEGSDARTSSASLACFGCSENSVAAYDKMAKLQL